MKTYFSDPLQDVEQSLLFSVEGAHATEVVRPGLKFTDKIKSIFDGTRVTEEIPVMVEGSYAVLNRATKQWENVVITADDIKSYMENTPRDVAVNYEHRREGLTKGWLRLKDTARFGILKTKAGEKAALFSSLELFPEAASHVEQGYFRDVSIELKRVAKEIIGVAMTSTPVMRDLQWYSNTPVLDEMPAQPEELPEAPAHDDISALLVDLSNPALPEEPKETPVTQVADKTAVLAEALAEFGLTPEDLAALPALIKTSQEAKQEARRIQAREHIKTLTTVNGATVLAPAGIEAAAQLYMFSQDQGDDLLFSVEGSETQINAASLLEEVFKHVQAVQVFGQADLGEGANIEALQTPEPPALDETVKVDEARVASIVSRIKSKLK